MAYDIFIQQLSVTSLYTAAKQLAASIYSFDEKGRIFVKLQL